MKNTDKPRKTDRVLHALFAAPARFLLRVHVHGRENIPSEGGHILLSNHMSFLDPIVLSAAFPRARMPKYLAKAELFRVPLLGRIIRVFGAIPVDRSRGDVGAIRRSVEVAKSGELLAVFPQGTRQKGKNPADTPIKHGCAMIAARAGVPVLPVCIHIKKQRYALFRRVDVIVGEPISLERLGLLSDEPSFRDAATTAFSAVCELGGYRPSALPEQV